MLGSNAARALNHSFAGCSVHRRGSHARGMFLDSHVRIRDAVINEGNMCPLYLHSLGQELASLDREIFDEFVNKCIGEIDRVAPQGRSFGTCPMLLNGDNCPAVFRQVRETTLFSVVRNFMCRLLSKNVNFVTY